MSTAIDSSVLFAILNKEPGWEGWSELLRNSLSNGPLLVCPVVFAEVSVGFPSAEVCVRALEALGISYSEITPRAAWLAGQVFVRYRQECGPRTSLIPDFIVAAHAQSQARRLAAIDRGYLRRYFSELEVISP